MARQDALIRITKTLLSRRSELRNRLGIQLDDLAVKAQTSATGDAADAAFEHTGEELASQLAVLESRELSQVEFALARIKQGKYGSCAGCSGRIPVARLNALPYSTLCVRCQQESEADSTWLDARNTGSWDQLHDGGEDREVRISDLQIDVSR